MPYRHTDNSTRPTSSRRGYGAAWRHASRAYLALHPSCVVCGKPATLVDHRIAHKGDSVLFWQRDNWQPMCASCHSRKTVRLDGGFGAHGDAFARGQAPAAPRVARITAAAASGVVG